MQYALEPGGVLFLGKAESQLGNHSVFRPLNSRWRVFQKSASDAGGGSSPNDGRTQAPAAGGTELAQHEMESLQLYQRYILETVKSGLLVLGDDDVILESQ